MTAKNWAYLTLGFPILFQSIMVILTKSTGYSFMDAYFLKMGVIAFLIYSLFWFIFLVCIRGVIISPWDRLFSSWIIFYHLFAGLKLWPSLLAIINKSLGGFIPDANFGLIAHYSAIIVLFFLVYALHAISKRSGN